MIFCSSPTLDLTWSQRFLELNVIIYLSFSLTKGTGILDNFFHQTFRDDDHIKFTHVFDFFLLLFKQIDHKVVVVFMMVQ
jgi:hypothetical protein